MHPLVYISNMWDRGHNTQQMDHYTSSFAGWTRMSSEDTRCDLMRLCSGPVVEDEPRVVLILTGHGRTY